MCAGGLCAVCLTCSCMQILVVLWRVFGAPYGVAESLKREVGAYDVTLLVLFSWLLVKDVLLRNKADSAKVAIDGLGGLVASAGLAVANSGSGMSASAEFVDITDIAEDYRDLKDLLAIVIVFGCLRVMKYMQMLPSLGPMLVAVMATINNNAVLLYLSLLAGTLSVFSVAFHTAVGNEVSSFVTVPHTIIALTEWMVGEVGYLDETPQRLPLTVLFVGFVLFLSIVLVNLFIGVVTDLYPTAKKNSEQDWDALITGMMQERFTSMMLGDRARNSSQNLLKLAGQEDDGGIARSNTMGPLPGPNDDGGRSRGASMAKHISNGSDKRSGKSVRYEVDGDMSPTSETKVAPGAKKSILRSGTHKSMRNVKAIQVSPSPTNAASPQLIRDASRQRMMQVQWLLFAALCCP